jgi:hypothetical protein
MLIQSVAHVLIVVLILVANVGYLISRRAGKVERA